MTLYIPFPTITSDLARRSHMYICRNANRHKHELVKCQTLKPIMLKASPMKHFVDEDPDIKRNPFRHKTRIDCDKIFLTSGIVYDVSMRTAVRPDVCENIMELVEQQLSYDGYVENQMNTEDLLKLNIALKPIENM